MGQQQLLLIGLAVIVVGIAIFVGISMFTASSSSSNRDNVILDLTTIASLALEYYSKPDVLGGGGNSFTGFAIPPSLLSTANGTYRATVTDKKVILRGIGSEIGNDGSTAVNVTMIVTSAGIQTTSINN